jgi:hypothetical protein
LRWRPGEFLPPPFACTTRVAAAWEWMMKRRDFLGLLASSAVADFVEKDIPLTPGRVGPSFLYTVLSNKSATFCDLLQKNRIKLS